MASIYVCGDNDLLNSEVKDLFAATNKITEINNNKFDIAIETTIYNKDVKFNNLQQIYEQNPEAEIITNSVCIPLIDQISVCNSNLTGASLYPTFSKAKAIELSSFQNQEIDNILKKLFETADKRIYKTVDRPGHIALRIVSLIINEAYLVLQEGTAAKEDIDTAMKLGTNYPNGPIEWSEKIGIDNLYHIISAMHSYYGDDRYRVTPLLYERFKSASS